MIFIDKELYKNKSGIYAIRNITNNKVYIGQTSMHFVKRYYHHVWKLRKNTHDNKYLQNSWNKYGKDNFEFIVLKIVENAKDNHNKLDEFERDYIKKYKDLNLSYNIQGGGQLKHSMTSLSEEHKRKIGEANRKNMLGKRHSEETKKKMSLVRRNKSYTRYKKTTVMNDNIVFQIKTRLVSGEKPTDVAKNLDIPYAWVNRILSNNVWSNILVDGWDEFQKNREIHHRLKKSDHENIYRLYKENKCSVDELSQKYQIGLKYTKKLIRRYEKAV